MEPQDSKQNNTKINCFKPMEDSRFIRSVFNKVFGSLFQNNTKILLPPFYFFIKPPIHKVYEQT